MRQRLQRPQRIQIRQLRKIIRRQHQRRQARDRVRDAGLDARDAVARQQQRVQAFRQREVAQDLDVVVGEVNGIVRLFHTRSISPKIPLRTILPRDGIERGR